MTLIIKKISHEPRQLQCLLCIGLIHSLVAFLHVKGKKWSRMELLQHPAPGFKLLWVWSF